MRASASASQLRYAAYIKEADDFAKLAAEAVDLFVKEALLETAARYRRLAEAQLGTSGTEGRAKAPGVSGDK
jgi:hypothetical protein